MKKKFLLVAAATLCTAGMAFSFASCGETAKTETKNGEYSYVNPWDATSYYGVKVSVTLDGETVKEVKVIDSDYVEVSEGWANKSIWENGEAAFFKAFEGKTVSEIKAIEVVVDKTGTPKEIKNCNFAVAGATNSSGRAILAVQNALGVENKTVVEEKTGEYKYENAWVPGSYYGIKVKVTLSGNKILSVSTVESDYVEVTESWDKKTLWTEGAAAFFKAFEGKTIDEVNAMKVNVNDKGEPQSIEGCSFAITGATNSTGRAILAIQDALKA